MEETIIITTVTESVKVSELNHREKTIYDYGRVQGVKEKRERNQVASWWFGFLFGVIFSSLFTFWIFK